MTGNTRKLDLYAETVLTHEPGASQDRAARLAVCQFMRESGHDNDAVYDVLDALALLPGTEHKRDMAGLPLATRPKDRGCLPTNRDSYVPN